MARTNANFHSLILFLVAILLAMSSRVTLAESKDDIDQLQTQLIELRATVDSKSEELSLLRQEEKQKRKFSLSQIAELESSIEDSELVVSRIDHKLKNNRETLAKISRSKPLQDDLVSAIETLTSYVSHSLPFKRKERLAALNDIKQQLVSKTVSAPRLANKLWAFVEDEIMLTKGNGVYRQIIDVNNEQKLVDVARIGMLMLYYRDGAGDVGMAKAAGDSWEFVELSRQDQQQKVHYLFDSFQKQIRIGEFNLPNTLAGLSIERGL